MKFKLNKIGNWNAYDCQNLLEFFNNIINNYYLSYAMLSSFALIAYCKYTPRAKMYRVDDEREAKEEERRVGLKEVWIGKSHSTVIMMMHKEWNFHFKIWILNRIAIAISLLCGGVCISSVCCDQSVDG